MLNQLKKWLLVATMSVLTLSQSTYAFSLIEVPYQYYDDESYLDELEISSISSDNYEFEYCISSSAVVSFGIYYPLENDSAKVHMFDYNEEKEEGCYSAEWDGEYGNMHEIGTKGEEVPSGKYFYGLKVEAVDGVSYGSDFASDWVYVNEGDNSNDNDSDENDTGKSKKSIKAENSPQLKEVYLTKEEFDPGQHESTFLVFTITEKADVKVTAYQDGDKVETVFEKDDRSAGTYAVEWEADGLENEPGTYSLKVEVANSKGDDDAEMELKIKEDTKDAKKPNVIDDQVDQLPYNPKFNSIGISFKMDRDADVTVEIRDDSKVVATVIDEQSMLEGAHTVYWNGKDKYGEIADDGIYNYKIIAGNVKGKDVEKGYFSLVDASKAKNLYDRCGGFEDVTEDFKYCDAIQWAADNEIFQGYSDGSYKPNQAISRSEVLKVIFKAREVGILSYSGETFGFSDLQYDWYSPYIKTALSIGVINGYNDGTFRPHQSVNRAEALAMLLRTGQAKDGLIIPTNNYGQPYYDVPTGTAVWYLSYVWFAQIYNLSDNDYYFFPAQSMTRAEMADMLYRYQQNV